jgi:hypothetical protein
MLRCGSGSESESVSEDLYSVPLITDPATSILLYSEVIFKIQKKFRLLCLKPFVGVFTSVFIFCLRIKNPDPFK